MKRVQWGKGVVFGLGLWLGAISLGWAAPLQVVATFSILADLVQQVGGEEVRVTTLVKANGDVHLFEPSPEDLRNLQQASLVVGNGLHLEGWLEKLLRAAAFRGQSLVASTGVNVRYLEEGGQRVPDPHAWNSAANAMIYVRNIMQALQANNPEQAAYYQSRGEKMLATLQELHEKSRQDIAAIPVEKRKILTNHESLGYFADAYGVRFLAPLGISSEAEANAKGVAQLIRQIRQENIRLYFLENSGDKRLLTQIGKETGAKLGGILYVESLSAADGPATTYEKMFRHNVQLMVAAMTQP
ncbi:metal ABC transporter substrate-binding protein [Candidatus Magnetaquicoccus inordinatus]|uniref:metal ABC transporter substrate-binding protein n=1 Tax=Candidatus Magnetaquicoccus inordinatus TaxID=2496818 RepID=UPI00102B843C|nr:metal ABC transporter substrate-binding protein [Candidatus Magnetaquicoccus inordinatus]